jgi:hypothetical protein
MTIIELRNKLNKFIDEQSNQEINHMPITFIRYSQPESKKIEDNV